MSPEQWGGGREIDQRADVFGMGATLYHALTLTLPYGRHRMHEGSVTPPRPSERQPLLGEVFDEVVLKSLESNWEDRYASVVAFQDDWRSARRGSPA